MVDRCSFFVKGSPATFSTRREAAWRRDLLAAPPPCLAGLEQGVSLDFALASDAVNGRLFDLDNLCEVVFSALVGGHGWFGSGRPGIRWWSATRRLARPTGCAVTIHAERADRRPSAPPLASGVYPGPLPRNARDPELAAWAASIPVCRGDGGRWSLRIEFGGAINIGDIATGRVKAVIDCLYPWLGGNRGSPEDHRIFALFVEQEAVGVPHGSVAISLWALAEETPATGITGEGDA
ncbi:MAG: hypothetical protein H6811_12070 [Phycisphaeraceae bacterium]|nr:hypothetical protein [Phycisphaeraceae bacterium]